MLVVPEHRTVFLLPMKTGTTSLEHFLRCCFPGPRLERWPAGQHHRHDAVASDELRDFTYILSVRHPESRALSLYEQAKRYKARWSAMDSTSRSFAHVARLWNSLWADVNCLEDWYTLAEDHPLSRACHEEWSVNWQLKRVGRSDADFILHQESLHQDLCKVCEHFGIRFPGYMSKKLIARPNSEHSGLPSQSDSPHAALDRRNCSESLDWGSAPIAKKIAQRFWAADYSLARREYVPSEFVRETTR